MPGINVKVVKVPPRVSYDPCVWRLFSLMKHQDVSPHDVAEKSGVAYKTLVSWLYKKRSPTLTNFRAAANALGYEIVLVPLESADRYYGPSEIVVKHKD
jgi:transcriptional regulator with XRE-family HTH domain